jgi:hypothetical protein
MRTSLSCLLLTVALAGCAGHDATTGSVELDTIEDTRLSGTFSAANGVELRYEVEQQGAGRFEVRFDTGRGEFGTDVDWSTYTAETRSPDGFQVTARDHAALVELARGLESQVGNGDELTDNLVRQANLWSKHPTGPVIVRSIVADRLQGWTTLCNGTSYRTFNWTWGSVAKSEYLKYGPAETTNPCRARCGNGCNAIIGTSAWTVDCGRHDRCEQYGGDGVNSQCNDEFTSASDDFTFAGNCAY